MNTEDALTFEEFKDIYLKNSDIFTPVESVIIRAYDGYLVGNKFPKVELSKDDKTDWKAKYEVAEAQKKDYRKLYNDLCKTHGLTPKE